MKIIKSIIVTAIGIASYSFTVNKFWHWFIEIPFDIRHLTYIECLGLWMCIAVIRTPTRLNIKKEYLEENDDSLLRIISPWVLLLIGYLVSLIK